MTAQRRIAVAPVSKPFHDGFHQILMDPVHRSLAGPDLANVRLMDMAGNEIHYVIRKHGSIPIKDITYNRSEGKAVTITSINFECPYPVEIEYIKFKISSPKVFNRRSKIFSDGTTGFFFNEVLFKSKGDSIYTYNVPMYTPSFTTTIENLDGPPFVFDDIEFFQPGTFIVADLKIANDYEIVYFDNTMKAPNYDMTYAAGQITDDLDLLKPGALKILSSTNTNPGTTPQPEISFWETTWFMWLCIAVVAIVVALVGGRMVKDMRERKKEREGE